MLTLFVDKNVRRGESFFLFVSCPFVRSFEASGTGVPNSSAYHFVKFIAGLFFFVVP